MRAHTKSVWEADQAAQMAVNAAVGASGQARDGLLLIFTTFVPAQIDVMAEAYVAHPVLWDARPHMTMHPTVTVIGTAGRKLRSRTAAKRQAKRPVHPVTKCLMTN